MTAPLGGASPVRRIAAHHSPVAKVDLRTGSVSIVSHGGEFVADCVVDQQGRVRLRHEIREGKQVIFVGWSYGGYAALMGAVKTPDLYRCAVSVAGVGRDRGVLVQYLGDLVAHPRVLQELFAIHHRRFTLPGRNRRAEGMYALDVASVLDPDRGVAGRAPPPPQAPSVRVRASARRERAP